VRARARRAGASACVSFSLVGACADMCSVLRKYMEKMRNASILIPMGGIQAMKKLAAIGNGRLMLLVGDKAYSHEVRARCCAASDMLRRAGLTCVTSIFFCLRARGSFGASG
jgi:DNA-binding MurR/RpiR family transcriptional regulator